MRFLFPFSAVPKGSRIVLYGAGEVGYDFYRQVMTSKYVELVLWVDRQYEWFRMLNLPVDHPSRIEQAEFDYVVITAERENVLNSIARDVEQMGISRDRLIWDKDYSVHENVVYSFKDRDIAEEAKRAITCSPFDFVSEDRLDIVIRYLYAKDIYEQAADEMHRNMYLKFVTQQWDEQEPTENYVSAYFSEYTVKRGKEAFERSFIDLVRNMAEHGYKREHFVPVDQKGRLINGAHRIAAAMACGIDVWYLKYPFDGLYYVCDRQALENMGFSAQEIDMLTDTVKNMGAGTE